ncbi:hypothetical protein ACTL6U_00760 [Rhodovibrionaceae bacterium A322]
MSSDEQLQLLRTLVRHSREEAVARIYRDWESRAERHPNPFCRYGRKVFSQSDEDGLTFEILRRLGLDKGTFAELGVGDGMENNSLALLAHGWKGFWIGGENLVIEHQNSSRLTFLKAFIDLDNLESLFARGLEALSVTAPDVVSLDLDGNDYHFTQRLLETFAHPAVFIVEYSARFAPPLEYIMDYDPQHRWNGDWHCGASLVSYANLFKEHGYFLVCCNAAMGVNAFFVKEEHRSFFPEVPEDLREIFVPPNFTFPGNSYGHPLTKRTINQVIR